MVICDVTVRQQPSGSSSVAGLCIWEELKLESLPIGMARIGTHSRSYLVVLPMISCHPPAKYSALSIEDKRMSTRSLLDTSAFPSYERCLNQYSTGRGRKAVTNYSGV